VARAEAYPHDKFHLDPSKRLATIHQRHRQTDRQTGQRTDSIGQTVLQTVVQKLHNIQYTEQQYLSGGDNTVTNTYLAVDRSRFLLMKTNIHVEDKKILNSLKNLLPILHLNLLVDSGESKIHSSPAVVGKFQQ